MTQLFIDNVEVALPPSFDLTLVKENPLVTRNGEFTWDITLDLRIPQNARIYRHINRPNNSRRFESRTARLYSDDRLLLDGREIILQNTDSEVKIQLVSGNSELNYFAGTDLQLGFLDLGVFDWVMDRLTPFALLEETNRIFAVNQRDSLFTLRTVSSDKSNLTIYPFPETSTSHFFPHLWTMLYRVIGALGFSVEADDYSSDLLIRDLYIAYYGSNRYADVSPTMTVGDFLTNIENLFGARIIVIPSERKVKILKLSQIYPSMPVTYIDQVLDTFTRKFDSKSNTDVSDLESARVKYNLSGTADDNGYSSLAALSKEAMDNFNPTSVANISALCAELRAAITANTAEAMAENLYQTSDTGRKYIVRKKQKEHDPDYWIVEIATLQESNPEAEKEITLSIVPAQIYVGGAKYSDQNAYSFIQAPITQNNGFDSSGSSAEEKLKGSDSKEKGDAVIPVCLHGGNLSFQYFKGSGVIRTYRASTTHGRALFVNHLTGVQTEISPYSLSPEAMRQRYWIGTIPFDPSIEYTYEWADQGEESPLSLFHINGQRYIPRSFEYKIGASGIGRIIKGIFYKMND